MKTILYYAIKITNLSLNEFDVQGVYLSEAQVKVCSCCESFVKLARYHSLYIAARTLGMKIVPCKENVQIIVTFALDKHILYPSLLGLLVAEQLKQKVYLLYIQIQHHQFRQHLVGDILDRIVLIAPQAVLLLEFFNEKRLDIQLQSHCFLLIICCKITLLV